MALDLEDSLKDFPFSKKKKSGDPLKCKFCHREIWWHKLEKRWYDPGGKDYHVINCSRRRGHYQQEAARRLDRRREEWPH